ncbi:cytochrome P450 [Nocardia brevicatena]|uniref:cytochrome P450 n=1 Tax=Nocardia brevicatena TaxID=37327 RepID=UPI0002DD7463|nr:cytochrome P450 [Nocardia brevicatena]
MTDTARTLPFDQPDPFTPPPAYAKLRATEPVAAVRTPDGQPAWLVTSYDAVAAVLGDRRFGVGPPGGPADADAHLLQDGESHRHLRRLVGKAFSPRRVELLRPRVEQLAEFHATSFADAEPPADLVDGFAAPLSIAVITELLGAAIEDRARFRALADAATQADFVTGAAETGWAELGAFVAELVAAKQDAPGEDLLTDLIRARGAEDGRLNESELNMLVLSILAAGYSTATNAITVGTTLLLTEGRFPGLAAADDEHLAATVEEIARLQIGVIGDAFPRWAHEDVELVGASITTGDMVLVKLAAANRDPSRFDAPDRFYAGRAPKHIAFGRGPHHCLGSAIARLEVGAALRALSRALPALRLAGTVDDIEWSRSHADTGPRALLLTW